MVEASNPDVNTSPELEKLSDRYHRLGRTALFSGPYLVQPTVSVIRCIFLMSRYYVMFDYPRTLQTIWALLFSAMGHAINGHPSNHFFYIGLRMLLYSRLPFDNTNTTISDRDPEPWDLSPETKEERRHLWWEMCFASSLQVCLILSYIFMPQRLHMIGVDCLGLAFGRPPSVALKFTDCTIGVDEGEYIDPEGNVKHSSSTIMTEVLVSSVKQKYSDIIALDKKIRDMAPEISRGKVGDREVGPERLKAPTVVETIQKFFLFLITESFSSIVIRHPKSILINEAMETLNTVYALLQQWASIMSSTKYAHRPYRALPEIIWEELPKAEDDLGLSALSGHSRTVETRHMHRQFFLSPRTASLTIEDSVPWPGNMDIHPALMEDVRTVNESYLQSAPRNEMPHMPHSSDVPTSRPARCQPPEFPVEDPRIGDGEQSHGPRHPYSIIEKYERNGLPPELLPSLEANPVPQNSTDAINWMGFVATLGLDSFELPSVAIRSNGFD
ncbi:hypothetical protein M422DRAFT_55001 [Sphaerobolus stellatus SS14]|uniref:Unplaced genomic scaffold SPHSTscaffold_256, whole genome shotgun sequence n=1 Tax=Sphaerobolus stellatus (strain SS14) TaxID=990650 RepID=A0A0C9UQG3_SPHS4|nr:hypothetical protein M422DRAFT_55001 [Sphaerobolus stellatus SS14]